MSSEINYAEALMTGEIVRHPTSTAINLSNPETFLSVSSDINILFGSHGPHRLFQVEVIGEAVRKTAYWLPWFAVLALKVVAELEARPGLVRRPLTQPREPSDFLAALDFFGSKEVHALANAYRLLGCPAAPNLAPEVPISALKSPYFVFHEKVAEAVHRAMDYEWPPDDDLKDATTAAQGVVTALLYQNLLSLEKISDLLAPWCVAFGDGFINWQGILEHRNGKRRLRR